MKALDDLGIGADDLAALRDFVDSWGVHDRAVLFVGAGMSSFQTIRKPDVPNDVTIANWDSLIAGLLKNMAPDEHTLDGSSRPEPLGVPQTYADERGRRLLVSKIERAVPYKSFDPGPAFYALTEIDWAAIVTTNYDDFLERAFERKGKSYAKIVRDYDLSRARPPGSCELIKMHGELEQPDTIVLCSDDYRQYADSRGGVQNAVRVLLAKHPILFLGFSLTDPNVTEIIDWVGTRLGKMKPLSIALVHEDPDSERAQAWRQRGVRLVRLPRDAKVEEFVEGLYHLWRPQPSRGQEDDTSVAARLRQTLSTRDLGWIAQAAALVGELVRSGTAPELHDAVHRVLYGLIHRLNQDEIRDILGLVPDDQRRAFLLTARRSGIVEGRGTGGGTIAIESALIEDARLRTDERAEVLVLRAERFEREAQLDEAVRDLREANDLLQNASRSSDTKRRIRRLLLRIGDEQLIGSSLLSPVEQDDAFACARRGADVLMTYGRAEALTWYQKAFDAAKNKDEKTAALFGLQACQEAFKWHDLSEFDPYWHWPSLQNSERPRVQAITELEQDAAEQVFRRYREGPKGDGNEGLAVSPLEQALAEADDMGWPRSPSPNFTGPADRIAYSVAGLLLRDGASEAELLRGLRIIIERGLLQIDSRIDPKTIERILNSVSPDRIRELLTPRSEVLFMRRTRALLASAFLSVLSDKEIEEHVARVLDAQELRSEHSRETTVTEVHLKLLRRHYHWMPHAAALCFVQLLTAVLTQEELAGHRHSEWGWVPLQDWSKTGTILPDAPDVQELVGALAARLADGTLARDTFALKQSLRLLEEAAEAGAVSDSHRSEIVAALDQCIERGVAAGNELSTTFSLILARHDLRRLEPSAALQVLFLNGYRELRNSSAAGTWMNLVGIIGPHLSSQDRTDVAAAIADYTSMTLQDEGRRVFGPFPDWPATAIHQAVDIGIMTPQQGWADLMRLAEAFPDCLVHAVGMQGADLDEAGRLLTDAFIEGRADNRAILRWCVSVPMGSVPIPRLERVLFAQLLLADADGEAKQISYWCLGWLAEKDALTSQGITELRDTVLTYGIRDRAWRARAGAVVSAAKSAIHFSKDELDALQARALADSIAGVRRAGGLLAVRRSGSPS